MIFDNGYLLPNSSLGFDASALILIDTFMQVWADAVCINQNDLDERSSQVSIMADIYKAAKHCQIWLATVEDVIDWPDEKVVSAFSEYL